MKQLFSSKEKITLAVVAAVLILYLALLQFYFLGPLKSDLKGKQQELASEQNILETLQKKSTSNHTATENTTALQEEVPVKPLQDQFILDLQQAEEVSNSQIKSMGFTAGGQAVTASSQGTSGSTTQTQSNTNSSSQTNTSGQTNTSSGTTAQQQNTQSASGTTGQQTSQNGGTAQSQLSSAPPLNKLTCQLSIESPNYSDLEKFINTLESSKRITVVESINYTGNQEITNLSQTNKPLDYTLTVSAYYYPGLTDLDKQLPKVDFPAPANKDNPLSQFASTDPQS